MNDTGIGSDAGITSDDGHRAVAEIATPNARRYLGQLCKHFQHRLPVELDGSTGRIVFDAGTCALQADAAVLTLSLTAADAAGMTRLQDVVARHLVRFAFREDLQLGWHPA